MALFADMHTKEEPSVLLGEGLRFLSALLVWLMIIRKYLKMPRVLLHWSVCEYIQIPCSSLLQEKLECVCGCVYMEGFTGTSKHFGKVFAHFLLVG